MGVYAYIRYWYWLGVFAYVCHWYCLGGSAYIRHWYCLGSSVYKRHWYCLRCSAYIRPWYCLGVSRHIYVTHCHLGDVVLFFFNYNIRAHYREWYLRQFLWIGLRWMLLNLTNDKSTLIQVMAWCRQATSHYLSQCWPDLCHHMASLNHNELINKMRHGSCHNDWCWYKRHCSVW